MLEYLKIKNHQSHRETALEFDKGVNIIFGLSLSGKTSILRAMQLAVENRPSGAKYYSNFAPDKGRTIIELKPVDTPPIKLIKDISKTSDKKKKLNSTTYQIGDGEPETGGDKDVPDRVRSLFNLSELNIQKQFAQPFLILSSSGEFARVINRVTKLNQVDEWVGDIKKRVNEAKNEVDIIDGDITNIEGELRKYAGFETLDDDVKALQAVSNNLTKNQAIFSRLDNLLEKIEVVDGQIDQIKLAIPIENDISALTSIESRVISLVKALELIDRIRAIESSQSELIQLITDSSVLEMILLKEEKLSRLDAALLKIEKADDTIKNLSVLKDDMQQLEKTLILEERFNRLNFSLAKIEKADEIIEKFNGIITNSSVLEMILLKEEKLSRLDGYISKINIINKSLESGGIEYNDLKGQLNKLLANTKECPIFQMPCLCVDKMMERIEK